ncbi:hypothetical protein D915_009763 [Fasciola hepatica]|uniref:SCP domain-containing protein n=1 Tax=Fasciola hepatica TaxID=6192 RepID=A0A2H1BU86_FASHE|nr:hypothetical protein D915_009763 [Fasciola hepatica]
MGSAAGGLTLVSVSVDEPFNLECLAENNRLRKLHGCPPILLDENLAKMAQLHAHRMAETQTFLSSGQ